MAKGPGSKNGSGGRGTGQVGGHFASAALAAAQHVDPSERFGSKIYIADAWEQYNRDHPAVKLTLSEFKDKLLAAQRAGTIRLSRADLTPALDFGKIQSSRIEYLGAEFNFINIP